MKLSDYLKDKVFFTVVSLFVTGFSAFLLYMVNANIYFMLFVPVTYLAGAALSLIPEFIAKRRYYNELQSTLDTLDKKSLLSEIIKVPHFCEGRILHDVLKETGKSMNDEIARHSISSAEYREYIELWVHEIKTPIAGAKLICENDGYANVAAELDRIDSFVEQVLFYSRSSHPEKDYIIKQLELSEIVNRVLRRNAKRLIESRISVELLNLDETVFTDVKWTDFILQQIIDNSIKYRCDKIHIHGETNAGGVSLFVHDNGIGIAEQDLRRVFEKGFTGENGRQFARSTGLGLYLCKKLCDKLSLAISVKSRQKEFTCVELVFPKDDIANLTKM